MERSVERRYERLYIYIYDEMVPGGGPPGSSGPIMLRGRRLSEVGVGGL